MRRCLRDAGVSYARRKPPLLAANFQRIQEAGGPEEIKRELEAKDGRDAKIKFLKTFRDVGPKYARDIMMDAYHPEFHDSVALDTRMNNVVKALGLEFGNDYDAAEHFLVSAAKLAGLNAWELDRLLYGFTDEVLVQINCGVPDRPDRVLSIEVLEGDFGEPNVHGFRAAIKMGVWESSMPVKATISEALMAAVSAAKEHLLLRPPTVVEPLPPCKG